MSRNEKTKAWRMNLGLGRILCLVLVVVCFMGCQSTDPGESTKKRTNPFSAKERKLAELETQISTLYGTAEKAQRSGKTHEARKAYEEILAIYDKNKENKDLKRDVEPYCRLGVIMETFGQYDMAEEYYRMAMDLEPKNPTPINSLGYCYLNQHRLEEAIEYFQKAVEIAPMEPKFNNNLALAYGMKKEYGQAFKYFRRVSSEDEAYYNMSAIFAMNNEEEKAKSALEQVVALNPNHREAQRMLSTYTESEQEAALGEPMLAGGYSGATVQYQPAQTSGAVGNSAVSSMPPATNPVNTQSSASPSSQMPGTVGTPAFTKTYGSIHHLR